MNQLQLLAKQWQKANAIHRVELKITSLLFYYNVIYIYKEFHTDESLDESL